MLEHDLKQIIHWNKIVNCMGEMNMDVHYTATKRVRVFLIGHISLFFDLSFRTSQLYPSDALL